jgi:hypothetical protein
MGRVALDGMLEFARDLDTVLVWHLQSNHYPPVPLSMIPACKAAIVAMQADSPNKSIPLPRGVSWRGKRFAPACEIVSAHHLDGFIREDNDQ